MCVVTLWQDWVYLFVHESGAPFTWKATDVRIGDLFIFTEGALVEHIMQLTVNIRYEKV